MIQIGIIFCVNGIFNPIQTTNEWIMAVCKRYLKDVFVLHCKYWTGIISWNSFMVGISLLSITSAFPDPLYVFLVIILIVIFIIKFSKSLSAIISNLNLMRSHITKVKGLICKLTSIREFSVYILKLLKLSFVSLDCQWTAVMVG